MLDVRIDQSLVSLQQEKGGDEHGQEGQEVLDEPGALTTLSVTEVVAVVGAPERRIAISGIDLSSRPDVTAILIYGCIGPPSTITASPQVIAMLQASGAPAALVVESQLPDISIEEKCRDLEAPRGRHYSMRPPRLPGRGFSFPKRARRRSFGYGGRAYR